MTRLCTVEAARGVIGPDSSVSGGWWLVRLSGVVATHDLGRRKNRLLTTRDYLHLPILTTLDYLFAYIVEIGWNVISVIYGYPDRH